MYRLYFKHFHPDKFHGHPAYALVEKCATLVNRAYSEHIPDACEFIIETGLMLKNALEED